MKAESTKNRFTLTVLGLLVAAIIILKSSLAFNLDSNAAISKIFTNDYHLKGKVMSLGKVGKKIINLYD